MGRIAKIARRTFLLGSVAAAGGLAVGYYMYKKPYDNPLMQTAGDGETVFTPYVKIGKDGQITIITPRAEMGQGVTTTLAALVAEELDVELNAIRTEHGPASKAYYNEAIIAEGGTFASYDDSFGANTMRSVQAVIAKFLAMQMTGGSSSTRDAFEKMRQAGAAIRHVLVAAAAKRWNVAAETLKTENGHVVDPDGGKKLSYGELAGDAANIDLPSDIKLKDSKNWRLLGKSQQRLDLPAKVTGAPIYGVDVELPDMVYGTVRAAPEFGAKIKSLDKAEAEKMRGVIKVIDLGDAVGVIADNTWRAFKAAEAVNVEWDKTSGPAQNKEIFAVIQKTVEDGPFETMREDGDIANAFATGGTQVEATYIAPFLAHSCMEPMNATARWKDGTLEVWTGTQAPTLVQQVGSMEFGIDASDVIVNTTSLGGGFGRRAEMDFVRQAMKLARHTDGKPVKMIWTREEDIQHDGFRPGAVARFKGKVDGAGKVDALDAQIAAPSVSSSFMQRNLGQSKPPGPDIAITDGAFNQPYAIPNYRVAGATADLGIPVGFWRAVGNSHNGFFHETFIDELAHAAGKDPVALRLELMKPWPAATGVIEKVAEMSNWSTELPKGKGRGIAFTLSFGTWVAEVVEVTAGEDGMSIDKVWCAADVGTALDPSVLEAQMQSGIIYGLSAAISQEITFAEGAVEQSNFHDYDALRIHQAPSIEVAILENSAKMGGAGEPGTPPAAPALGNAIFAATGKRLREMPFDKHVTFKS